MDLVIGIDLYNQVLTGGVSKSLTSIACDSDHLPCVLIIGKQNEKDNCSNKERDNS